VRNCDSWGAVEIVLLILAIAMFAAAFLMCWILGEIFAREFARMMDEAIGVSRFSVVPATFI